MLTVNSQTTDEIIKESRHFSAKLVFGSKEYEDIDSFTYTSHFSPNKFTVGCVTSASVKCDIRGLSKDNQLPSTLKGQVFKLMISVGKGTAENPPEWLMLGEFKITEAKLKDGVASITAYDKLNFVSGTYTSKSTGKKDASDVFAEVCGQIHDEKLGFTSEYKDKNGNLLRYQPLTKDYEIDNVDTLKGYPLKDVLSYLACLFGRNVVVNRQGLFEIRQYGKMSTYNLFNNDRIETPDLAENDSVFGYLSAAIDSDTILTSGDTTGSGFLFACPIMSQTRLDSLSNNYSSASNVVHSFRPGKVVQLLGDPRIEAGDVLPLNPVYDKDGNLTSADCFIPVMSLVMKYDGGLMNEITAYDYEEDTSLSLAQKVDFADKSAKRVTQYANAVSDLTSYIGGGLGLYKTEMTDASGAVKTYLHDGETISRSTYIITVNSNGFAFSTTKTAGTWLNDASNITWTNGITKDGNAVMQTIAANKITADMIDVTELSALGATVGGWNIGKGSLCYPNSNAIYKSTSADENGFRYEVGIKSDFGSANYNNFYVAKYNTSDGTNKRVFAVNNSGAILATKGTIGGWEILEKRISSANNDGVYSVIQSEGSTFLATGLPSADSTNATNAKFIVYHNGTLKATQAEITGKITATSGSFKGSINASKGTIGGFDIKDPYMITSGKDSIGVDGCLYFNPNGSKSIASVGGSGSISGWVIAAGKNFGVTSSGKIYATSGLIGGFDIGSSYMITSGKEDIGVDGCLYFNPSGSKSTASVGGSNSISGWMIAAGKNFGVLKSGRMYATGANISGTFETIENRKTTLRIDGSTIDLLENTSQIRFKSAAGSMCNALQYIPLSNYGDVGLIIGDLNIPLHVKGYTISHEQGISSSDERIKKNIEAIKCDYENLFKLLQPVTFKYVDGTSDRRHLGFIAQQVKNAAKDSGISTQNIAAYVEYQSGEDGFDGYKCGLRYGEFVALNTHMIQKCLKKIEALETEINILKGATT